MIKEEWWVESLCKLPAPTASRFHSFVSFALQQEEHADVAIPVYSRTMEEYLTPFNDPNSPVSKAGLEMVATNIEIKECLLHAKFQQKLLQGMTHCNESQYTPK